MIDIHRFEFGEKSHCGLRVWKDERRVQIFELAENDEETLAIDNILVVAKKIKDAHFPNLDTSGINWNFVNGYWQSSIEFDEENGLCKTIRFGQGRVHNSLLSSKYSRASLVEYSQRYPLAEVEKAYSQSIPNTADSEEIFPVYLPKMNGNIIYQKRNYLAANIAGDHEVVIADAQKVLELWLEQTFHGKTKPSKNRLPWDSVASLNWHTGHDAALLGSNLQASKKHTYSYPIGNAQELPQVHYRRNTDRPLSFTNGRHRLYNALNCGAPFVPLEMYRCDETEAFKMSFGWEGQNNRRIGYDLNVQSFGMN